MKKEHPLLKGTESLSEQQKLQLFAIEELETRLEMAANIGGAGKGVVTPKQLHDNYGCSWS